MTARISKCLADGATKSKDGNDSYGLFSARIFRFMFTNEEYAMDLELGLLEKAFQRLNLGTITNSVPETAVSVQLSRQPGSGFSQKPRTV